MGFWSSLLARFAPSASAAAPEKLANPKLGFANFIGTSGEAALKQDAGILGPLFPEVEIAEGRVPLCDVLFVYGEITSDGELKGGGRAMDLARASGASLLIVASENGPDGFTGFVGSRRQLPATLVLIADRRGAVFTGFFLALFTRMFDGQSMLMAWVELAPQIPGQDHPDCPVTMMLPQKGHLAFYRT
jgi:hypothetical protein